MPAPRRKPKDEWKLQDAKARFSELVDRAVARGPQIVTRRGLETVVVVPMEQWRQVSEPNRPTLKDLLLSGPRDQEFARIVDNLRKKPVKMRPPVRFD
jgi:prevent-host-death family protein